MLFRSFPSHDSRVAIESMQIINLFHAHKHSGIRKIAFIDHALKALDNSFDYKLMREYRAVLI